MSEPVERTYLVFPETVERCPHCRGWGAYVQRYIEGRMIAWCESCKGAQLVYVGTFTPVGESVRQQFVNMNGLSLRKMYALGALKEVITTEPGEKELHPPYKPSYEMPVWPERV